MSALSPALEPTLDSAQADPLTPLECALPGSQQSHVPALVGLPAAAWILVYPACPDLRGRRERLTRLPRAQLADGCKKHQNSTPELPFESTLAKGIQTKDFNSV